ncbi:MAG: hypothetical protein IT581_17390 [Verrucomicrobiales bacterium]|nr:hypothetical protein [Verrucomicrobiales bacterium]
MTKAVLENQAEHGPTKLPQVELKLRTGKSADVLVSYNEATRKSDVVVRRSFFLLENEERLLKRKRPHFVAPPKDAEVQPIPILNQRPAADEAPDLYAVSTLPLNFLLMSRGQILAEFSLPAYGEWYSLKNVLLLPLATAADATGIGAAIGGAAALGTWKAGGSFEP